MPQLADIIDLSAHPIDDAEFRAVAGKRWSAAVR